MTTRSSSRIPEILDKYESELLNQWLAQGATSRATARVSEEELRDRSRAFLSALREGAASGVTADIRSPQWNRLRKALEDLASRWASLGFNPTETATFVFSFKQALFLRLREEFAGNPATLSESIWEGTLLLDNIGLYTSELFQKTREAVISRQQQELMELSTPVVKLWEGILALPLIGTLDSARTQVVMQNLLEAIVNVNASIAIIDITGVPTVDTLVAQHLLKTVSAARLMGADCIISGIRPQIAQTIIHLGVELSDVTTKATLADAFKLALRRTGANVVAGNS